MISNGIYPGDPETNFRLQSYDWTIKNDLASLVFHPGLEQNPAPTPEEHQLQDPPEVESFVWGLGKKLSVDKDRLRADVLDVVNVIPSLALDASFQACRTIMAKDSSLAKHKPLEGIKADRDLLERLHKKFDRCKTGTGRSPCLHKRLLKDLWHPSRSPKRLRTQRVRSRQHASQSRRPRARIPKLSSRILGSSAAPPLWKNSLGFIHGVPHSPKSANHQSPT